MLRTFTRLSRTAYKVPSQPAMPGPVHSAIEEKLSAELSPQKLEVRNDSSLHAHHHAMVLQGGGNGETRGWWLCGLITSNTHRLRRHRYQRAL